MAKYCAKCGKVLPEGVEICPTCNTAGQEDGGAALFTRITADTETWKTKEETKKERPKRTRSQKQMLVYAFAAVAVVVVAVALILYVQPVNRVTRALRAGNYDRAATLYWNDSGLSSGAYDSDIGPVVAQEGEKLLQQFARHEISMETASAGLTRLRSIGANAEALLADTMAAFDVYSDSRNHMEAGNRLTRNGEYLAAREEYLLVAEGDSDYTAAREEADESLARYADGVLSAANLFLQNGDYGAAVTALEEGRRTLLGYEVYNGKLEDRLAEVYQLFEEHLLAEAENLAGLEDYAAAAELLRQNMETYDYETDALTAAMEDYLVLAGEKAMGEAAAQADRIYDSGDYAGAFAYLEELETEPGTDKEALDALIAALEYRFSTEQVAKAALIFDLDRENLPEAVDSLKEALKIRELAEIRDFLDAISEYLPGSLAEIVYTSKEGTLLRSLSTFEGLDGTEYTKGWIWGENGTEVTFTLDGAYDLMEGVLTVCEGREAEEEAGGHFEVYCDGRLVYASDVVEHWETEPHKISVDISGCKTLTLRFLTDYTVSTADGGYCFHGFCNPTVTKNLPQK